MPKPQFNPLADSLEKIDIGNGLWIKIKEELSEGEHQQIERFHWGLFHSAAGQQAWQYAIAARDEGKTDEEIEGGLKQSFGDKSFDVAFEFAQGQALACTLAGLKEWNLKDKKGDLLEISKENLLGLKRSVFQAITEACVRQYQALDDERKKSSAETF